MVTLWDVNDATTASFMKAFYRRVERGVEQSCRVAVGQVERTQKPSPPLPRGAIRADRQIHLRFDHKGSRASGARKKAQR